MSHLHGLTYILQSIYKNFYKKLCNLAYEKLHFKKLIKSKNSVKQSVMKMLLLL